MFLDRWIVFGALLALWPSLVLGQCCKKKVVSGVTYKLISSNKDVPKFCLGGCIYTKEDDPVAGVIYCFREGDKLVTCRDDECGSTEGWIKHYFTEECSVRINSYLGVDVVEQPIIYDELCVPPKPIINATIVLFDNPTCEGTPVQEAFTRAIENGTYSTAVFFVKTENTLPWSVAISKQGFIPSCNDIGLLKPFTENTKKVSLLAEENNNNIIPSLFINFTFDVTNQLLPDVFVQASPINCIRTFQAPPGSFQSEYGKCFPTCRYSAWDTDPKRTTCMCKGIIGGGVNVGSISLPNQQNPDGKATIIGSLFAYQDTLIPVEQSIAMLKFPLTFVDFLRRKSDTMRVCDSNLEVALTFLSLPIQLSMKVPCFAAQIPIVPTNPTGNPSPANITQSPNIPASGQDSSILESMFSEVKGVLVWGGGDRFWIAACFFVEVTFFTTVDPALTPEFCACIITFYPDLFGNATRDHVKSCYLEALQDGPSPRSAPLTDFAKRMIGIWK